MKKIKAFFNTIYFIVRSKLWMWKYRIQSGKIFSSYEITSKGEEMVDYCLKVLNDENYIYQGYKEYLFDEALEKAMRESDCTKQQAAMIYLSVLIGVM